MKGVGMSSDREKEGTQSVLQRRLAAILAADVVGFSRLMGADEQGTYEPHVTAADLAGEQ